jgi:hypothetical protein
MRVTRNGAVTSQTRRWSKAPRSTASKGAERRGGNGRGDAEQLLSREFFEGYERRGECDDRPRLLRQLAAVSAGNATNPRVGSGMQQARDSNAEEAAEVVQNHEGGTGIRAWQLGSEARWRHRAGVDASKACRWRGGTGDARASGRPDESHERRPVRAGPGERGALETSQRHEGTTNGSSRTSRSERKTSRTRPATGKVEEGTGKANRPVTREPRGSSGPLETNGLDPTTLKAR